MTRGGAPDARRVSPKRQLLSLPDVPPSPLVLGRREREPVVEPRRPEVERELVVLRVRLFAAAPLPSAELFAAEDRLRAEAVPALLAAAERLAAVDREPLAERVPDDRAVLELPELDRPLVDELDREDESLVRVAPNTSPDSIRCAASATASAISEPSRVALLITELAALLALSAASKPASRIFFRALGLALIAAAAAASPAASISLLIAAFASLSNVSLPVSEERCCAEPPLLLPAPPASFELAFWFVKEALPPWLFDLPVVLPLATSVSPSCSVGKTVQSRNGSVRFSRQVKGSRHFAVTAPSNMVSGRSVPARETKTACLELHPPNELHRPLC